MAALVEHWHPYFKKVTNPSDEQARKHATLAVSRGWAILSYGVDIQASPQNPQIHMHMFCILNAIKHDAQKQVMMEST